MKTSKQYGKEGAKKRWRKRYDALQTLLIEYGRKEYNRINFEKWPEKHLLTLIEWVKKSKTKGAKK